MIPIFATGPVNKIRVIIGWLNVGERMATFEITPKRMFQEAKCIGIDSDVFKRKSVSWCREFVFRLYDGRQFRIKKEEFEKNCWEYPPGGGKKEKYKANFQVFKPKLMLTLANLEKLAVKPPTEEEKLKEDAMRGAFG